MGEAGAAFVPPRGAGVVDEGAAHEQGAEVVEVLAAFQLGKRLGDELQEEFVDQGGGLPEVAGALP